MFFLGSIIGVFVRVYMCRFLVFISGLNFFLFLYLDKISRIEFRWDLVTSTAKDRTVSHLAVSRYALPRKAILQWGIEGYLKCFQWRQRPNSVRFKTIETKTVRAFSFLHARSSPTCLPPKRPDFLLQLAPRTNSKTNLSVILTWKTVSKKTAIKLMDHEIYTISPGCRGRPRCSQTAPATRRDCIYHHGTDTRLELGKLEKIEFEEKAF